MGYQLALERPLPQLVSGYKGRLGGDKEDPVESVDVLVSVDAVTENADLVTERFGVANLSADVATRNADLAIPSTDLVSCNAAFDLTCDVGFLSLLVFSASFELHTFCQWMEGKGLVVWRTAPTAQLWHPSPMHSSGPHTGLIHLTAYILPPLTLNCFHSLTLKLCS